ncbi:unnamed protein product, partial [Chrysoparadoxa australica]
AALEPRDKSSLRQDELEQLKKEHSGDQLPEGWYFDGSGYVSCDGKRSRDRPDLDQIINHYLGKQNETIEAYNAGM